MAIDGFSREAIRSTSLPVSGENDACGFIDGQARRDDVESLLHVPRLVHFDLHKFSSPAHPARMARSEAYKSFSFSSSLVVLIHSSKIDSARLQLFSPTYTIRLDVSAAFVILCVSSDDDDDGGRRRIA